MNLVILKKSADSDETDDFVYYVESGDPGVDFSDGQFLMAMRCRCFFSSSNAMLMVLATSYHRNRCDYF